MKLFLPALFLPKKSLLLKVIIAFIFVSAVLTAQEKEEIIPPIREFRGARVAAVYQVSFDRIVEFKLESRDELGYPKVFYLVIEIMGKHSNIILLDEGKTIVDSVKHLDSSMNRR
jgi:hypothetical protein